MTQLMQLTDVAETGRLEPVTAAIRVGEILHLVGQGRVRCWRAWRG